MHSVLRKSEGSMNYGSALRNSNEGLGPQVTRQTDLSDEGAIVVDMMDDEDYDLRGSQHKKSAKGRFEPFIQFSNNLKSRTSFTNRKSIDEFEAVEQTHQPKNQAFQLRAKAPLPHFPLPK